MDLEKKIRLINMAARAVRRAAGCMLALALLFVVSTLCDMYAFTAEGLGEESFPGFDALFARNPDAAAWLSMDGTHINHPVAQGADNFEYLTKSFDGEYYQGGSIFLDAACSKDLSDEYIIIHGHNMSGGAMFSDLNSYLDETFFEENRTGELITPEATYALTVCGAGTVDAYDSVIYTAGPDISMPLELIENCSIRRDVGFGAADKLVVLSTCSGDMTTGRTVVFCRAKEVRKGVSNG